MQFCSIDFIFYFFPLSIAVYMVAPFTWRNAVLVGSSLVFYYLTANGSLWQFGLLVGLIVVTYLLGLLIRNPKRKGVLYATLGVLAALLMFFKCYNGGKLLPPGFSFYLFQIAAYLIDVSRGKVQADGGLIEYGTQIVMFPKLLSGPISNPKKIQMETQKRKYRTRDFHEGLEELIIGLSMKVIIANRLGGLWSQAGIIGYQSISTPFAWMALIAYTLRLYFDFYGYSLMAIGIGKMIGFHLPRNFLEPYSAKTISDFYRRWHATLGAWFRDYVYIPLGGNRKGEGRTILNICIVWLLTGIWHGIGWNYLIWAAMICALILAEKFWYGMFLEETKVLGHIYVVFFILLSWAAFAIPDMTQLGMFFAKLFGFGGASLNLADFVTWGERYFGLIAVGILFATPLPGKIWEKIRRSSLLDVILFILFWFSVYFIATSAQDPFVYFQF